MVSSADVTERLMARFEGTVPLTTVGEVVRRVLREHHGLLPPSMSAVERQPPSGSSGSQPGRGPGRCPEVRVEPSVPAAPAWSIGPGPATAANL